MIILARWQLGPVINICILSVKCEVNYIMFVGCHLQINKTRIYTATFIILPSEGSCDRQLRFVTEISALSICDRVILEVM